MLAELVQVDARERMQTHLELEASKRKLAQLEAIVEELKPKPNPKRRKLGQNDRRLLGSACSSVVDPVS